MSDDAEQPADDFPPDFVPEDFESMESLPAVEPVVNDGPETVVDADTPSTDVEGPLTVLEHVHDEAAGVYRIVVGNPIFHDGVQVNAINCRDFLFADDDERWLTADGSRRNLDAIAAEQRVTIKSALEPVQPTIQSPSEPEAVVAAPVELPGVGDEL